MKDSLEYIIESWIYNLDVEPFLIDIDEATEYTGTTYFGNAKDDTVTPEAIMEIWNRIAKEEMSK